MTDDMFIGFTPQEWIAPPQAIMSCDTCGALVPYGRSILHGRWHLRTQSLVQLEADDD